MARAPLATNAPQEEVKDRYPNRRGRRGQRMTELATASTNDEARPVPASRYRSNNEAKNFRGQELKHSKDVSKPSEEARMKRERSERTLPASMETRSTRKRQRTAVHPCKDDRLDPMLSKLSPEICVQSFLKRPCDMSEKDVCVMLHSVVNRGDDTALLDILFPPISRWTNATITNEYYLNSKCESPVCHIIGDLDRYVDEDGWTLLHLACRNNDIKIAHMLLAYGISVNKLDRWQRTALFYCPPSSNILECLLSYGSVYDKNDIIFKHDSRDSNRQPGSHNACRGRRNITNSAFSFLSSLDVATISSSSWLDFTWLSGRTLTTGVSQSTSATDDESGDEHDNYLRMHEDDNYLIIDNSGNPQMRTLIDRRRSGGVDIRLGVERAIARVGRRNFNLLPRTAIHAPQTSENNSRTRYKYNDHANLNIQQYLEWSRHKQKEPLICAAKLNIDESKGALLEDINLNNTSIHYENQFRMRVAWIKYAKQYFSSWMEMLISVDFERRRSVNANLGNKVSLLFVSLNLYSLCRRDDDRLLDGLSEKDRAFSVLKQTIIDSVICVMKHRY